MPRKLEVTGWAVPRSGAALRPWKFHRRAPGPRDLLVDIAYCGVCHSDIHEGWDYGDGRFPMVPGHEIVGRVERAGAAVKRFATGAIVGVGPYVASDRTCALCRRGLESYCPNVVWTYDDRLKDRSRTQGGYSSRIVVSSAARRGTDSSSTSRGDARADLESAGSVTHRPLAACITWARAQIAAHARPIPSLSIFDCSVERLRPRRAAAPRGPATTPFVSRST
jgi:uncharacterized zinc-type alcohol dehydrogenase-like protein